MVGVGMATLPGRPVLATPMLVNTAGRSLACSLIHLLLPPEPDQQVHFYQTPRIPHLPGRHDQGPGL
jgi:hypothetical protein